MNESNNRAGTLGYHNLARGIGMVMVLWYHSNTVFLPYEENVGGLFGGAGSVIGGGIMALFFMMSGNGFYKRSPKKCFSIQKKNLLRPYWITAAAVLVTKLLLALIERRSFLDHGGQLIPTYLLGLNAEGGGVIWGVPVQSVSIFWFVLALFGGWTMYNAILQEKDTRRQWLLITLCVVVGWALNLISRVWPFCLSQCLLVVGYLAAGVEIRKRELTERPLPWWCWAALMTVAGVCAAFGEVNVVAGVWRLGLLDVIGSYCWGFLLLRLYALLMKLGFNGRLTALLESVGFYSLWVVCLHGYEKIILPWHWLAVVFPDSPMLCALLCFAARSVIIYLMYLVLSSGYGKWKGRHRKPKIIIE